MCQIVGVDVMDLPVTESGNKHVLVFQDFLTKWPMVYPIPNQQTVHIVRLFAEQVVPMFGVPEALLSDRGTNLLSHLRVVPSIQKAWRSAVPWLPLGTGPPCSTE